MKNIIKENDMILRKWESSNKEHGENNFAPDGAMHRGEVIDYGHVVGRLESSTGLENKIWTNAPLRVLFFTKDQNSAGCEAWDVRGEMINFRYAFFRNLAYQLYGIVNTDPNHKADWNFTYDDAKKLYNTFPLARINAKKEGGKSTISNSDLRKYLERDKELLKAQILNLDADIIFCCGFSEKIEKSGNLLLNFLNEECGFHFERQSDKNWIYYDKEQNKVAINDYHLSVRYYSPRTLYTQLVEDYFNFVVKNPSFCLNHRN